MRGSVDICAGMPAPGAALGSFISFTCTGILPERNDERVGLHCRIIA